MVDYKKKPLFRRLCESLFKFLEIEAGGDQSAEKEFKKKVEEFRCQAEAASYAIARFETAKADLQREIQRHDGFERQAEQALREGNREAAEEFVELQLRSAKNIDEIHTTLINELCFNAGKCLDDLVVSGLEIEEKNKLLSEESDDPKVKEVREILFRVLKIRGFSETIETERSVAKFELDSTLSALESKIRGRSEDTYGSLVLEHHSVANAKEFLLKIERTLEK